MDISSSFSFSFFLPVSLLFSRLTASPNAEKREGESFSNRISRRKE
jgi:hypothetical protein